MISFGKENHLSVNQFLVNHFLELLVERDPVTATRKEVNIDEPILK